MSLIVIPFVFSNGTVANATEVNSNNTAITSVVNGGLDGTNFANGAIPDSDLADEARVAVYFAETLAPASGFVNTGLQDGGSSGLNQTITSGTAYVKRTSTTPNAFLRVRKASSSVVVLTATSDNYVDLLSTGSFLVVPVSVGANEPGLSTDGTRIAKVTTNASAVTAYVDKRTTTFRIQSFPKGYRAGIVVDPDATTPASKVILRAGAVMRDKDDSFDGRVTADITCDLDGGTGLNKLDTGSPAINTNYALHAVFDSTGVAVPGTVFSLSATTPTLPAGYDKSQYVTSRRNDAAGNLIEGVTVGPETIVRDPVAVSTAAGVTANWTQQSIAAVGAMSPARMGIFEFEIVIGGGAKSFRVTDGGRSAGTAGGVLVSSDTIVNQIEHTRIPLDSSQRYSYLILTNAFTSINHNVMGWVENFS